MKRYDGVVALGGVDLRVPRGRVVGLVGPNGSGKTTLLHAVAGLARLDAGFARVAGAPAGGRDARSRLALVPDEPAGFDELTVAELVSLVHALWRARPGGGRACCTAARGVRAWQHGVNDRLGALSRGLRRQAAAVAAFSLAPPLVLVDEATATLDPEAVVVLQEAVAASRGAGRASSARPRISISRRTPATSSCCFSAGTSWSADTEELLLRRGAASLEGVFLAAVGEPACVNGCGMACVLCRAVLRCQARRLLALGTLGAAALGCCRDRCRGGTLAARAGGCRAGRALGPALGAQTVARALVAGLALAGAAAGAALAVSCPGRQGLGPQLAAGPVGAAPHFSLSPSRPLRSLLPGAAERARVHAAVRGADARWGAPPGGALVLAALAGSAAGAVVAEAAVHVSRGRPVGAISAAVLVSCWIALGAGLGAPALGPLALVAGAVAGTRSRPSSPSPPRP